MKYRLALHGLCLLPLALTASFGALAQSFCSSDGQLRPVGLVERFINADCASCWTDAQTPVPQGRQVALDWIVPGLRGDDAPLSAASRRDGLYRLQALQRATPLQSDVATQAAPRRQKTLRVAHGMAFNGYLAASIEMRPRSRGPWTAWLALVENVPAGTEGTPVERNLVRNTLQSTWDGPLPLSKSEHKRWMESRPMQLPEGTNPQRLRVIGWVEDAQGRIQGIAQSACVQTP